MLPVLQGFVCHVLHDGLCVEHRLLVSLRIIQFFKTIGLIPQKDTERKARILGVEAQMKTFNFLFGVMLGEAALRNTHNLSETLQHQHLSAVEGQRVASRTVHP